MSNSSGSKCIACADNALEYFGHRDHYAYHMCRTCGTLQLFPMPSEDELARAYKDEYSTSGHITSGRAVVEPDAVSRMNAKYHSAIVETVMNLPGSKTTLEIGSGYGGMCRLAIESGIPWEGIDLSRDAADFCLAAGLPVKHSSLSEVTGAYGVIVMCFVFEHLANYDGFLAACRERLNPGGRIVTLHPTAEFARFAATVLRLGSRRRKLPRLDFAFTPPWHTCLMSSRGIKAVAHRNGFRVESTRPSPIGRFGSVARRAAQAAVGLANSVGWHLIGTHWPLIPAYLVVLQRTE